MHDFDNQIRNSSSWLNRRGMLEVDFKIIL